MKIFSPDNFQLIEYILIHIFKKLTDLGKLVYLYRNVETILIKREFT